MSDLVGTSQALFGMGDKLKVVWSDVKSALGLGPSIEDQQGALIAGPMMAEVKAQLTDQAGTLKGRASTFAKGAFGGIRGDMDTSFGRGSSINPFTARAGSQIQEMTRQSNLMLKQAAKLDTSNALLTDIRAAVKSFNLVPTYN
jgi:hypothetical protein